MKLISKIFTLSILAAMFGLYACGTTEDPTPPSDQDISDTQTETLIDLNYDEIQELSFNALNENAAVARVEAADGRLPQNITIVAGSTAGTNIMTIDWGSQGVTGPYGRVRKGILEVTYPDNYWAVGAVITIKSISYSVNGIKVDGIKTVTNMSFSVGTLVQNVVLTGGKLTWPDETFATREFDVTRTWNYNLTIPQNDTVEFTGNASGTNRAGVSYTSEITSTIKYKRSCAFPSMIFIPVSGTKTITTANHVLTVDFGDGTCDQIVTVSLNGVSKDFNFSNY